MTGETVSVVAATLTVGEHCAKGNYNDHIEWAGSWELRLGAVETGVVDCLQETKAGQGVLVCVRWSRKRQKNSPC
jgi:hypothetical protein